MEIKNKVTPMPTKNIDVEYERYKDWDMSDSKPANLHPMVKKLQDNKRLAQLAEAQKNMPFDEDVVNWVSKQDANTRSRINEMIRQVMGMYQTA